MSFQAKTKVEQPELLKRPICVTPSNLLAREERKLREWHQEFPTNYPAATTLVCVCVQCIHEAHRGFLFPDFCFDQNHFASKWSVAKLIFCRNQLEIVHGKVIQFWLEFHNDIIFWWTIPIWFMQNIIFATDHFDAKCFWWKQKSWKKIHCAKAPSSAQENLLPAARTAPLGAHFY